MKLLIVMKLWDVSLDNHIRPICEMEGVEHIDIIRDMPGPVLPKVTYHCPPGWLTRVAPLNILFKLAHTIILALTRDPDLLLAYFMWPHGIIAFITAKLTLRPVSISMISHTEMDAMGPIFTGLHIRILKWSDFVTVTGSKTRDKLRALQVSPKKIFILPHIVNLQRFLPKNEEKRYDLLYLGRIGPRKHVEVVLKMGQRMKMKGFQDIRIGIVGAIDDIEYQHCITSSIAELDLSGNVEMIGPVSHEEASIYYNRSRIFVLPSGGEGLPFTLLEAMACGIPVIVTDVGDVSDVARNQENAMVIPHYSDIGAFVDAATSLLSSPGLMDKLRENGLREVTQFHTARNVQETWSSIFSNLRTLKATE